MKSCTGFLLVLHLSRGVRPASSGPVVHGFNNLGLRAEPVDDQHIVMFAVFCSYCSFGTCFRRLLSS